MNHHHSMKLALKAASAAAALAVGAVWASPDPIIGLEVEYKRATQQPAGLNGVFAGPGKFATSLRMGVAGSFSKTRATAFPAACEVSEANERKTEEARELQAGLIFKATVRSITDTMAVFDISTGVTDLIEIEPYQFEVCAVSATITMGANYDGRIALPLDGSPIELPLRDGEVLVLRVAKSPRGPI